MNEFEITITLENSKQVQARAPDRDPVPGDLQYGSLRKDTLQIFEAWLRDSKKGMNRSEEFQLLGRLLYDTLFNGEVEKLFEDQLREARKAKKKLIVRLSFKEEAAVLADLPWEYLYYKKEEEFFLSTVADLVLSRSTGSFVDLQPEIGPLRLLIVISSPEGDNLVPVTEVEEMIQAIRDVSGNTIQPNILNAPTVDDFLNKLGAEPHLLHFIGHGRLRDLNKDKKEAQIALFEDNRKDVRWVGGNEFADYFRQMQVYPRLVLLHLCENAKTLNSDTVIANFAHLGRELMRVNIPAVVAMQYPIPNEAAIAFSSVFYQELIKGESIDEAVREGRWRMAARVRKGYDTGIFGMPVLYVRSRGGIIQPENVSSPSQEMSEAARTELAGSKIPVNTLNRPSQAPNGRNEEIRVTGALSEIEVPTNKQFTPAEAVRLTGRETIKEMKLPIGQKRQLLEQLSSLTRILVGREKEDIFYLLFDQKDSCADDDPFIEVIQSMIAYLEEMP